MKKVSYVLVAVVVTFLCSCSGKTDYQWIEGVWVGENTLFAFGQIVPHEIPDEEYALLSVNDELFDNASFPIESVGKNGMYLYAYYNSIDYLSSSTIKSEYTIDKKNREIKAGMLTFKIKDKELYLGESSVPLTYIEDWKSARKYAGGKSVIDIEKMSVNPTQVQASPEERQSQLQIKQNIADCFPVPVTDLPSINYLATMPLYDFVDYLVSCLSDSLCFCKYNNYNRDECVGVVSSIKEVMQNETIKIYMFCHSFPEYKYKARTKYFMKKDRIDFPCFVIINSDNYPIGYLAEGGDSGSKTYFSKGRIFENTLACKKLDSSHDFSWNIDKINPRYERWWIRDRDDSWILGDWENEDGGLFFYPYGNVSVWSYGDRNAKEGKYFVDGYEVLFCLKGDPRCYYITHEDNTLNVYGQGWEFCDGDV